MLYTGEIAGLTAALLWSGTAMFFTAAGNRIGSFTVNVFRLTIAIPLLGFTLIILNGTDFSSFYSGGNTWYIILSGLIGLAIGDSALFEAWVRIGPRRGTLLMALVPIITALSAFILIGEVLSLTAWIGILMTISGVVWVIIERDLPTGYATKGRLRIGVIFGLIGASCQAVGLVLAKAGMGESVDPLAATLLRMTAGATVMWLTVLIPRRREMIRKGLKDAKALLITLGGAVCGPYLGVWMSLVSVRYIEAGVGATLMGTVPIWTIPWVWIFWKERTSFRAVIGTVTAIIGVAVLFSR